MSERSDEPTTSASSAASMIRHLLERYRLPGFDLEALQADIDAISRAKAVAFKGAKTITEDQVDLLKAALDQLNEEFAVHGAGRKRERRGSRQEATRPRAEHPHSHA